MVRRRTGSRSGWWDTLRVIALLGFIALVLGYVYGSMAVDFIHARQEGSDGALLRFFGLDVSSLFKVEAPSENVGSQPASEATAPQSPASEPPAQPPETLPEGVQPVEALEVFYIQLGSFNVRANAERLSDELAEDGYEVQVTEGPPYRLRLGASADRALLEPVSQTLQAMGYETFIGQLSVGRLAQTELGTEQHERALLAVVATARDTVGLGVQIWTGRLEGKEPTELVQQLEHALAALENALSNAQELQPTSEATVRQLQLLLEQSEVMTSALATGPDQGQLPPGYVQLLEALQSYEQLLALIVQ